MKNEDSLKNIGISGMSPLHDHLRQSLNFVRKAAEMYRAANEQPKTCSGNLRFHHSHHYDFFILTCLRIVEDCNHWICCLPPSSLGDVLDSLEKTISRFLQQKMIYDQTVLVCDLIDQEGHQCQ